MLFLNLQVKPWWNHVEPRKAHQYIKSDKGSPDKAYTSAARAQHPPANDPSSLR